MPERRQNFAEKKSEDDIDALLFVSFGGPEGMDDVMPFLENVLRGKNVPLERMRAVARHYEQFGGVSPINGHTRALIEAVKADFAEVSLDLPIYWGNRNWHPMLADTMSQMKADGIKHALAFVTSAYSSYSGCRQYLEDIDNARLACDPGAPRVTKLRTYFDHPGFIEANAEHLRQSLTGIGEAKVIFSAHSIPVSMADGCQYESQLRQACTSVSELAGHEDWQLVFQSRSGSPGQAWLEPDICDYIEEIASQGVKNIVVLPIGFICDHMEVLFDIDTEAASKAESLGMRMVRARTVGTHPLFVRMIRQLVEEYLSADSFKIYQNQCLPGCCLPTSS